MAAAWPLFKTPWYTLPYDPSPIKAFVPKLSVMSFNSSTGIAGTAIGWIFMASVSFGTVSGTRKPALLPTKHIL